MRMRVAVNGVSAAQAQRPASSAVALFRQEREKRLALIAAIFAPAAKPARRSKAQWPSEIDEETEIVETPGEYIVMRRPNPPLDLSNDPDVIRYRAEKARRMAASR